MSRCSICEPTCKFSRPSGPLDARVMCIGEKPGREEEARGTVFVGDTGKEWNQTYLPLAGLDRSEVYVTNTVKCRLGGTNDKPTDAQIRECARYHLPAEIETVAPELIILMGGTACSEAVGISGVELDKDHGMPISTDQIQPDSPLYGYRGALWAMYHPAVGLHNTGMMGPQLEDWARLGKWLRGRWSMPQKSTALDYTEIKSKRDLVDDFVCGDTEYEWLPVDTESVGRDIWSMQYSLRPGHARMVRDPELIRYWYKLLLGSTWGLSLHFANHDLGMLEQLCPEIERRIPYRDTVQEAYHLRNLPQGLKALGWRLFGIRMTDYMDIVEPASRRVIKRWLSAQYAEVDLEPVVKEWVTKVRKEPRSKIEYKETQRGKDLKRLLKHCMSPTYKVWAKCDEAGIEGYPRPGIHHVDYETALTYACQDADVQGRLTVELDKLRREAVKPITGAWHVDEDDWDDYRSVAC